MRQESDLQSRGDCLDVVEVNAYPIQQELMILTAKVPPNHVTTGRLGLDESPVLQNRDGRLAQKHNPLGPAPALPPTSRGFFKQALCNEFADPVSHPFFASG